MISFISIFLEWLMCSYFLIRSFIMAKCPNKFCSHWVNEFHTGSCKYYCGKNVKCLLCLLWHKRCSLYRPLLKHLFITKISINTVLIKTTLDKLEYNEYCIVWKRLQSSLIFIQFTEILKFSVYNSQVLLMYLSSRISNKLLNIHVCLR